MIWPFEPRLSEPPKPCCNAPETDVTRWMSGNSKMCCVSSRTVASVIVNGVPVGYCTCTKIWPRSCAGKNSKPTTPSGISAIAPAVSSPTTDDDRDRIAQRERQNARGVPIAQARESGA